MLGKNKNNNAKSTIIVCSIGAVMLMGVLFASLLQAEPAIGGQGTPPTWIGTPATQVCAWNFTLTNGTGGASMRLKSVNLTFTNVNTYFALSDLDTIGTTLQSGVCLYQDTGTAGWDGGDTLLGTTVSSGGTTPTFFVNISSTAATGMIDAIGSVNLLVVLNVSAAGAAGNEEFNISLQANSIGYNYTDNSTAAYDKPASAVWPANNIKIDITTPSVSDPVTVYPAGQSNWAKNGDIVTLNVTASDTPSGLSSPGYVNVNATNLNASAGWVTMTNVAGNYWEANVKLSGAITGTKTLTVNAADKAGNKNTTVTLSVSVDADIPNDLTGTTVNNYTATSNWTNNAIFFVNWTGNGDNAGGSGIQGYYYKLDSAPTTWNDGTFTTSQNLTIDLSSYPDGDHPMYIWAVDNAHNKGNNSVVHLRYDTTPPTLNSIVISDTSTGNTTWTNALSVTLTLTADDSSSGMGTGAKMCFSNDGPTWSSWEPYSSSKIWNLPSGAVDGIKTVYFKAKDVAGNEQTSAISDTIILDTTVPSISPNPTAYPYGKTAAKNGDIVTLNATVTDAVSGVNCVTVNASSINSTLGWVYMTNIAGTNYWVVNVTVGTPPDGTHYLLVNGSDNVSNKNLTQYVIVLIDTVAPYSHATIYINGNSQFTSANGVSNPSAAGTASDPYIIENWDINASSAHGIYIENTNAYFIIRNSVVHDGKTNDKNGIYFYNVANGKIDNVTSYNNYRDIYLYSSSNNNITNCAVYNNTRGIYLDSSYNNITNCNVYNNSYGIHLRYSSNNILRNNILENNTYNFGVYGESISEFYHDIDTSNTINGKQIYYITNQDNLVFDDIEAGYLGLISCSNIVVKNLTLTNNFQGILLVNTSYSTITANQIYNNSYGIYLSYSSNNNITNCNVYNNSDGIYLSYSSYNNITNCNAYNNGYGIMLPSSSSNNQITNCNVYNNSWYGIFLLHSSNNNIITNCNVYDNSEDGIRLLSSSNNQITNCDVYNHYYYGIYLYSSSNNNQITNCNVYNNGYGIRLYSSSNNNQITNCTISNSGSYDIFLLSSSSATVVNTTFTKTKVYFDDATSTLTVKYYLHVKVINSTSSPISGATVRVRDNANGTFDQNYTTGSDGWVRWIECTEYWQNQTSKIYYTPHNVTANKTGYVANYASPEPNMDVSKEVTITLSTEAANQAPTPTNPGVQGYLSGTAGILNITNHTPTFNYTYTDPESNNQSWRNVSVYNITSGKVIWYKNGSNPQSSGSNVTVTYNDDSTATAALQDGCDYYFNVTCNDTGSNKWSSVVSVKFHMNTLPTGSTVGVQGFLAGTAGILNITNHTPPINWTYSDSEGSAQSNYNISVWTGPGRTGTLMGFVNTTGSITSWIYSGSALVDGTDYYANVQTKDGYEWSTWIEVKFHMNTPPPTPTTPIIPTNGATGISTTTAVNWTAITDAEGSTITYYWYIDDNIDFSSLVSSGSNSTNTSGALSLTANTKYYWRVRAYDGYEYGVNSTTWNFTAASGNTPPNPPTLVSPENNTWTNDSTPYFDWNFSDPDAGNTQGGFYVQIDNASNFGSVNYEFNSSTNTSTYWQFPEGTNYTTLPDGVWYWRVKTKDNNGVWGGWSEIWVLKIDTVAPSSSVNVISPYVQNTSPITVTATASDDFSGLASVELWYRFSIDNITWGAWTLFGNDTASPWSWSFTFPSGGGYYEFYSRARDNATNYESAPAAAAVDALCQYQPGVTPYSSVNIISPYWQNISPLNITANASACVSAVALYYRYSANNVTFSNWTLFGNDTVAPWVWSFNFSYADGFYEFYSIGWNASIGYEFAPASADAIAGYDTTAPINLSILINNGDEYTNSRDVILTLNATDNLSGCYLVQFRNKTTGSWGAWGDWLTWGGNGTYTYKLSPGDGDRVVEFRVKDRAGNIAIGATDSIMLDTGSPFVTAVSPLSGATGVAINTTISKTFSVSMNKTSVEVAFKVYQDGSATPLSGTYSWTDSWQCIFTSSISLVPNTKYWSNVTTGAKNLAGTPLGVANNTWLVTGAGGVVVTVNSPNGGEIWAGGATHSINYTVVGGTAPYIVKLYYSTAGSGGPWTFIAFHNQSAAGTFNYTWLTPNVNSTTCYVNISVNDSSNSSYDLSNSAFTIDSTAPTSSVNIILPYWQTTVPFTITATASDAVSGVKNVTLWYRYSADNSTWSNWTAFGVAESSTKTPPPPTYAWNFTAPNGNGYYQFYSIATDNANNVENAPTTADVACGIDTTMPEITITGVTDGSYYNVNVTPIIEVVDINLNTITITLNGVSFVSDTIIVEEGNYTLFVQATDKAGNTATKTIAFTIDKTKPTIDITGVINNTYYNVSIIPIVVVFDLNLNTTTITLNGAPFASDTIIADENDYILFVEVSDKAGNTAQKTVSFTIDKTPPNIMVTGIVDNAYYNVSVAPVIDITDLNLYTTTITLNDAAFVSSTIVNTEGEYVLFVQGVDKANNAATKIILFTIDKTKPSTPSLISPGNSSIVRTATPAFVWSAVADTLSGLACYEIQVDNNANFLSLEWSSSPTVNTTTSSALLDGTYYWRVRAIDNAGNVGDWSGVWNFTIVTENQPPVIKTWSPTSNPIINETESITFSVVASDINEDDLTYAWYINGEITGETGTAYTFISNYDSAGTYIVNVTVSDGVYYVSHEWTLTVNNVNRAPVMEYIGGQQAYEGTLFVLQVNASDPDNDSITFSDDTGLFNISTDGLISFTPDYESAGEYIITISVTDGEDVTYEPFILTIINVNRAPIINSYSPSIYSTVNETENQTFTISASDPDGNSIGYAWYLNNIVVAGKTNSSYMFTSTYGSSGVYNITVFVTDGKLSVNHSWTLWVSNVNVPPVAGFVYYEGIDVADNETVNIALRVAGTKYKTVNMTISDDNGVVGNVSITREAGCPDNKTLSILMDSSQTYIIVLDYTAEENGGNPVWVTINYRNISNKMHLVFNVNKNETQTRMFNLTETLDMMIRGVCLIKFGSTSYDPDGSITGYEWVFDDGTTSTDMVVYHYYTTGNHTVGLTVTDNNGASGTVYRNITVLDAVEYYSEYRGMVGVTLDCPADLLITDKYGSKIGFENGEIVNLVPNATVIVCGDVEIYLLPRNTEYDYIIAGVGPGEYKFTVFSPGEYGPGEYDPGEYGPGEYGPGEYGPGEYDPGEYDPGEYSGKTYMVESDTSAVTVDGLVINMDAGTLKITSNSEKYYTLMIMNGTKQFTVSEISISSGTTHSYMVEDWDMLEETNVTSVRFSIDENNDGVFDRFFNLTTGSVGKDLLKPDLTITDVSCSNENPSVGEQVMFYVTIRNMGCGPAHSVDVSLYVDDMLVDSTSISVIWTNRTAMATLLWVAKAGNHSFAVVLDADKTVNELNENNNEYVGNVSVEGKPGIGFDYMVILIAVAIIIAVVCTGVGVRTLMKKRKALAKPSKQVVVKCQKCGETLDVTGLERPTDVVCPKCGEKETLK